MDIESIFDVSHGFTAAWDRFRAVAPDIPYSDAERRLAEAFFSIGRTAGLEQALILVSQRDRLT